MNMIRTLLLCTICASIVSTPAFAGRGQGGVHSKDASNVSRYNERQDSEEKAKEEQPQDVRESDAAPAAGNNETTDEYEVEKLQDSPYKPITDDNQR